MHTLLDLRGNSSTFINISDGKLHNVNVLDDLIPEPGAFYVMDRVYIDFVRLHRFHKAGSFFVTRAKSNMREKRRYSHPVDRSTGMVCDQTITLIGFYAQKDFGTSLRRVRFRDPKTGKTPVFLTSNFALPALTIADLYRCRWQVELIFQMGKAASADQSVLWNIGERGRNTDLDCRVGLCACRDRQKAPGYPGLLLRSPTDPELDHV